MQIKIRCGPRRARYHNPESDMRSRRRRAGAGATARTRDPARTRVGAERTHTQLHEHRLRTFTRVQLVMPSAAEPESPTQSETMAAAGGGTHGSFRSRAVMYVLIAMFEMTNCA